MRLGSCFPTIDAFAFEPQLCINYIVVNSFPAKVQLLFSHAIFGPEVPLNLFFYPQKHNRRKVYNPCMNQFEDGLLIGIHTYSYCAELHLRKSFCRYK